VIFIDTSGVGTGDGGWNDSVLNGLFKMLASTVAHTYSIKKNELGHIEKNLKMMLPFSVVAPRRSFCVRDCRQPPRFRSCSDWGAR